PDTVTNPKAIHGCRRRQRAGKIALTNGQYETAQKPMSTSDYLTHVRPVLVWSTQGWQAVTRHQHKGFCSFIFHIVVKLDGGPIQGLSHGAGFAHA
ncbi:hypothetical protein, partial [Ensifer canadensis]|uniref:hypothetical protein n=1 Tax=Ensifer canadensis TaxID=555315 RepID=UPI001AEF30A7